MAFPANKNTRKPLLNVSLAVVPVVAMIGIFFGLVVYHLLAQERKASADTPGQTFRQAWAQEYEVFSPQFSVKDDTAVTIGGAPARGGRQLPQAASVASGAYQRVFPDASSSIQRLKDYIVELRTRNDGLLERLDVVNSLLAVREDELSRVRQSQAELAEKAAAAQSESSQRIAALTEKMELLQSLLTSREEEIKRLREDNRSLDSNLSRLFDEHLKLKDDFDTDVGRLSNELEKKQLQMASLSEITYTKQSLENQIRELTNRVADLNSVRVELENQLRQSRRLQIELQDKLTVAQEELGSQRKINLDLQKRIARMQADLDQKSVELENVETPYHDLQQEISKLKVIKDEYEKRVSELNERLAAFTRGDEETSDRILQLTALLTKNELEHEFELQEQAEKALLLEERAGRLDTENQSLLELVAEKERQINTFKTTHVDSLKTKLDLLQSQLRGSLKEKKELQKELARTHSLSEHLHRRMKKMYMELQMRRAKMKEAGL